MGFSSKQVFINRILSQGMTWDHNKACFKISGRCQPIFFKLHLSSRRIFNVELAGWPRTWCQPSASSSFHLVEKAFEPFMARSFCDGWGLPDSSWHSMSGPCLQSLLHARWSGDEDHDNLPSFCSSQSFMGEFSTKVEVGRLFDATLIFVGT